MNKGQIKILYFNLPSKKFPISVKINGDPEFFDIKVIYLHKSKRICLQFKTNEFLIPVLAPVKSLSFQFYIYSKVNQIYVMQFSYYTSRQAKDFFITREFEKIQIANTMEKNEDIILDLNTMPSKRAKSFKVKSLSNS